MSARDDFAPASRDGVCTEAVWGPMCDEIDHQRRDITALRSELASIAIMLQERGKLPDPGGDNFALVAGAVLTYILELERERRGARKTIHGLAVLLEIADEARVLSANENDRLQDLVGECESAHVVRDETGRPVDDGTAESDERFA